MMTSPWMVTWMSQHGGRRVAYFEQEGEARMKVVKLEHVGLTPYLWRRQP